MSKYFILTGSADEKITGSYPQVTGLLDNYNDGYDNPLSLYFFAHQKGLAIDYTPDLTAIKISQRAKLTDYISCGLGPGNDFIISSRFRELLTSYKASKIQYFPCLLHKKQKHFEYYWVHCVYALEQKVDYEKSEFTHVDDELAHKLQTVKTYQGFLQFYENDDTYGLVRSTKIILKCAPLDFFVVGRYDQQLYVSEKLKDDLVAGGFIGFKFEAADSIFFYK